MSEWIVGKVEAWFKANEPSDDRGAIEEVDEEDADGSDATRDAETQEAEVNDEEGGRGSGSDDNSVPRTPEQRPSVTASKMMRGGEVCGMDIDLGEVASGQDSFVEPTESYGSQSPFGRPENQPNARSINTVLCGRPSHAFLSNPLGGSALSQSSRPRERRLSGASSDSSSSKSSSDKNAKKRGQVVKEEDDDEDEEDGEGNDGQTKKKKR